MNKISMILVVGLVLAGCDEEPDITRVNPEVCDNERPNQNFNAANFPRTNGSGGCDSDADCTEGINGRCVARQRLPTRTCDYDQCFSDDGCANNEACSCGKDEHQNFQAGRSDANSCIVANCRTNEDCGDQFCKPDSGEDGRVVGYFCTTENDDCRNDSDCRSSRPSCTFLGEENEKWSCVGGDG